MKATAILVAILCVASMPGAALAESIVILKSGEVLHGDIVSDTNEVLEIRAYSANRTISSLRDVPRADVQNIHEETPAEAAERVDYFALSKFQLNPDQEQTAEFYNQWIAAFQKFLHDFPASDKVAIIQQELEACRAELKHVADGEVKFGDRWMTPLEKEPLVLAKQLAELQQQRDSLAATIGGARGKLAGLQTKLQTLQDTQEPIYETRLVGRNHSQETYYTGQTRIVPNPERPKVQADIVALQQQIGSGNQALYSLDAKIQGVKAQIPEAQRAYEAAVADAKQKLAQAAAQSAPPPPPAAEPAVPPPVVAAPESWLAQHQRGLAIGGGLVLIALVGAYPLKRFLQKSEQTDTVREGQRRVARAKLKKVFDDIFREGERPAGQNAPEGEVIPIGLGEDAYGGGRWFVVGDSHIWAVQNNGRDNDNWVYNNVITKGHGAVGARIPMDAELADYIRGEANGAQ